MRRPSSVGDRASEAQERSTVRGSAQAHSNGQNPGYGARPTRARAATRADAARATGPGGSNEPAKRLSTHMHSQSGACAACAVQTAKVGEYPGLAPRRARACRARQRRPSGIKAAPGMRSQSCLGRPREEKLAQAHDAGRVDLVEDGDLGLVVVAGTQGVGLEVRDRRDSGGPSSV